MHYLAIHRIAIAITVGFIFASTPMFPALAGSALLIGNTYINQDLNDLPTTKYDLEALSAQLNGPHFPENNVEMKADVGAKTFDKLWNDFLKGLTSGVALFYFSGHGLEIDGESYLMPHDMAKNAPEARVLKDGIRLERLFREFKARQDELKQAGKPVPQGVFIIDACRTRIDPEEGGTKNSFEQTSSLRPAAPPPGIFVFYSTGPGQVAHTKLASADRPEDLSVYTRFLISELADGAEGKSLQRIARNVRWTVYQDVINAGRSPQKPSYFDEVIDPINIFGNALQMSTQERLGIEDIEPKLLEHGKALPDGLIWECELCPEMTVVPTDQVSRSSGPALTISVERPFAMGMTEVTGAQYAYYLTSKFGACPADHWACQEENDARPVVGVTWADAKSYVDWLNGKLGLGSDRGRYVLPSEAEWEYAARGGASGPYVFGHQRKKLCRYGNGADLSLKSVIGAIFGHANALCNDHKGREAAQVKSYKENAFRLFDVHGNVWEWVDDCAGTQRATVLTLPTSGPRGKPGDCTRRIARGGSWRSGPEALRLDKRKSFPAYQSRSTIGFRVMRTLSDSELHPEARP